MLWSYFVCKNNNLFNSQNVLLRSKDKERRRAETKARGEKHRAKLYSNPEMLEEYRRKERERKWKGIPQMQRKLRKIAVLVTRLSL